MQGSCSRCGATGPALSEPPMPGRWGQAVFEQVCRACWDAWRSEQTLVMNHYGLRPWVPADREQLYRHMSEYLRLRPPG